MSTLKAFRSVCPTSKCSNECSAVSCTCSSYWHKEALKEVAPLLLLHLKLLEKVFLNTQIFHPLYRASISPPGSNMKFLLAPISPFIYKPLHNPCKWHGWTLPADLEPCTNCDSHSLTERKAEEVKTKQERRNTLHEITCVSESDAWLLD